MLISGRKAGLSPGDSDSAQSKKQMSSDYSRRKLVDDGVVKAGSSSFNDSGPKNRLWAFSSVKRRREFVVRNLIVAFEKGCGLNRIEEGAFQMYRLESIVIPSSVVVLGKGCFYWCKPLEIVIFESGSRLERIEESAFRETELESIEIPSRVNFIDGSAFLGLRLDSFSISRHNEAFRLRESFLESSDGSVICRYLGSCRSVVIPSSVVVVGPSSFCENRSIASVIFENGSRLERIEACAFRWMTLTSIVIPSSVLVLGKESFDDCTWLKSVSFENGSRLERIEESAFRGTGLTSIVVPSSAIVLGKQSFYRCKSLESVIFESGSRLERIEESAFCESGLKSIVIPSSVVVLGKESFYWCKSLESITFENGSQLERIEDSVFRESGLRSIAIQPCVNFIDGSALVGVHLDSISISPSNERFRLREYCLESSDGSAIFRYFDCALYYSTTCRRLGSWDPVVIPSSVLALCRSCFCQCQSLASLTFERGSRLERIEESAFACSQLKSIVIPSSVVVLGKASFFGCKPLESFLFEEGSRLERIEESAFQRSRLNSIVIPSSGGVLGPWSFSWCDRLQKVVFESGSRLERIEESAFEAGALRSIVVPSSVVVWGKRVFAECYSDISAIFDNGSSLKEMDESLFVRTPCNFPSFARDTIPSTSKAKGTNEWG
jgi:hypothetical protein